MTKVSVHVRRATPADFETVQRQNAALFAYEDELDRHTRNLKWPETEFAITYFRQAVSGQLPYGTFIAEVDGQPVGYLIAALHKKLYMRSDFDMVAELENMMVEEPYRRQGVGTQLVEAYKDWARQEGASFLRVGAWAANHPAVAFYQRHGFAILETVLEQPVGGWND